MSRRVRIPAPFQRIFPSIIRTSGPKVLFVAASCAALLVVGGGSYLLSHATPTPAPSSLSTQKVPLPDNNGQPGQVLGTDTESTDGNTAPTPASNSNSSSAAQNTRLQNNANSQPGKQPSVTTCNSNGNCQNVVSPSQDSGKSEVKPNAQTDVVEPVTSTLHQVIRGVGLF